MSGNRGLSEIPPIFLESSSSVFPTTVPDRSSRAKDDWHHVGIWAMVATIALTISVWGVQMLLSQIGYLPLRLSYLPHLDIYRIGISNQGKGTYLKSQSILQRLRPDWIMACGPTLGPIPSDENVQKSLSTQSDRI